MGLERLLNLPLLTLCMLLFAVSGDRLLESVGASDAFPVHLKLWSRALIDNATHAVVAGFTWALVVYPKLGPCLDEVCIGMKYRTSSINNFCQFRV